MKNYNLTKSDEALLEDVGAEFEMDLQAVFSLMQADVLSILEQGGTPEEMINKIDELLR